MKVRMMNKMTIGAIAGIATGLMVASNMDRRTRKRIRKVGKRMINSAEELYHNVNGRMH
ncbi:YtxH domain-containing protein [Haloimpatiens lingqiaonensis]|uniref:YtxH domain-containing protein n=1 Tax=Haloimpatiens lingqiaonensis TaxID=1380675 RepID=UPI0010FE917B|nr:YtxH domain-containing protein [Haloimpatiens lingqiaonensis]